VRNINELKVKLLAKMLLLEKCNVVKVELHLELSEGSAAVKTVKK